MALPEIYSLQVVPLAGHLRNTSPNTYCSECNRQIRQFSHLELVLDDWPTCDLISDETDSQLFASERLLEEFEDVGIKGYADSPVSITCSRDFLRRYPEAAGVSGDMFRYRYLTLTHIFDGPWTSLIKGENCKTCGYPKRGKPIKEVSIDQMLSVTMGDVSSLEPILVEPVYWTDEDMFFHAEKPIPIVTERVIAILSKMEGFRRQKVEYREQIRQTMPDFAAELDRHGWELPACSVIGPAGWVLNT